MSKLYVACHTDSGEPAKFDGKFMVGLDETVLIGRMQKVKSEHAYKVQLLSAPMVTRERSVEAFECECQYRSLSIEKRPDGEYLYATTRTAWTFYNII